MLNSETAFKFVGNLACHLDEVIGGAAQVLPKSFRHSGFLIAYATTFLAAGYVMGISRC
jgi:hypothetical protein